MLEIMQFIFSSFWIWAGTVILIGVPFGSIASIRLIEYNKNIKDNND